MEVRYQKVSYIRHISEQQTKRRFCLPIGFDCNLVMFSSKTLIFFIETFQTYEAAREAEKISENFSTLTAYARNGNGKRQIKRPDRFESKIVKPMESNVEESAMA